MNEATGLRTAVHEGNVKLVKELIAKGADVHGNLTHMDTPLRLATAFGHKEVAKVLKHHGAIK